MNRRCILTGVEINADNDSKAHVIPSALGGRLKPTGILSKDANTRIGDLIDLPLTTAFQPMMTLINGSRDRGRNQGVRMTDSNGRSYLLNFDQPIRATRPEYKATETDAGTQINISARDMSELRILLGKVKKDYPNFDIEKGLEHARHVETWPDDYFHLQLQCGPGVVFPALFVAASVFAVHNSVDPHPALRLYVDGFNPAQPALPPDTFYFIPERQWIRAMMEAGHVIGLVACPTRRQILVSIDIFNCTPVGIVLPYGGSVPFQASYGIDVTTGKEVPVEIDTTVIHELPWMATHALADQSLRDQFAAGVSRIVSLSYRRIIAKEISDALARAVPDDGDREVTDADLVAVAKEFAAIIIRRLTMPSASYVHAEKSLETFDDLSVKLEGFAQDRTRLKNRIRPLREQFVDIVNSARKAAGQ
ncbi:hypothetical protein BV900_27320 [Agrobacterium tumefaciens]|nr:hypothetical protein BV900_27320 [Agrobacterium tumefaciens]